ncbi:14203_t:CDS:1, partial [Gigaspora rosea]
MNKTTHPGYNHHPTIQNTMCQKNPLQIYKLIIKVNNQKETKINTGIPPTTDALSQALPFEIIAENLIHNSYIPKIYNQAFPHNP